ncbi:hypothetical protein BJ170DRAFT_597511 [Xylariales sp. AK1849]|nr:hypothetical protein BJ170DRAFT_597511 [Xylariales sp. AK1849]
MARAFVVNEGPMRARLISPVNLSTTAEYHQSLRDQSRQVKAEPDHTNQRPRGIGVPENLRRWTSKRPETSGSGHANSTPSPTRSATSDTINSQLPGRELEELETLPTAIRRQYFSTSERSRFAPTSGVLDGSFHTGIRNTSTPSLTLSDDKTPPDHEREVRSSLWPRKAFSPSRISPSYQTHSMSTACLPLANLPTELNRNHLAGEEQLALARSLREGVILDAADEVIHKIGRRSNRHLRPRDSTPSLPSTRPSMEAPETSELPPSTTKKTGYVDDAFYDSFRWLGEDEDLDLRLFLDDYHANLREALPSPTKEHRPSFRRRLSITKIPFGRSSVSTSRPATKDAMSTPTSPTPTSATHPSYVRRTSRALSLITPRHAAQGSTASIDPAAAHYQDPEARLKLRVYLASPQKFDEAVEFGFPSDDVPPARPSPGPQLAGRAPSRHMLSDDSGRLKTFLSDDRSSTYSDEPSLADPDSPKTPHSPEKHAMRSHHMPEDEAVQPIKACESYAHAPAASREMTLRMTLTRPDLRAGEDQIYGWQKGVYQQAGRSSQSTQLRQDSPSSHTHIGDTKPKESLEKFFAYLDQAEPLTTDKGVVKRMWNRVRRN